MFITVFENIAAPSGTPGKRLDLDWEELKHVFSEPDIVPGKKNANCVIFGKTKDNLRGDVNVESRGFAVLDFDGKDKKGLSREELYSELDKLKALKAKFFWHTTFSSDHEISGLLKVRVVIPLAFSVPASEWRVFADCLQKFFPQQDLTVKNEERVFYFPSVPNQNKKDVFIFEAFEGELFASSEDFSPDVTKLSPSPTKTTQSDVDKGTQNVTKPKTVLTETELKELAKRLSRKENEADKEQARRLRSIVKGDSFAEKGERHKALISVVGLVAGHFPDAEPRSLSILLRPALAIWNSESVAAGEGPIAASEEYIEGEFRKFVERDAKEKAEREAKKNEESRVRLAFRAALDAKKATALGRPDLAAMAAGEGFYSPEELAVCREISGSRDDEEMRERWILYFSNGSCAFLSPYGYSQIYGVRVAEYGLHKALLRSGLDMTNDKGEPLGIKAACVKYGMLVKEMVYSLSAQKNYYDAKKDVFFKAVAAKNPDLFKRDDPSWSKLIDLMSSDKSKIVKDWLASVDKTDEPLAALYIDGTQGAGKGLLVNALCKLWKGGRSMEFEALSKSFQYFNSPLVTINEGLGEKASTEVLRRILGNNNMRVSQKFEPDGFLEGCVRVIVTANNPDVLSFGKETLNADDQNAMAKRVVTVEGERVVGPDGEQTSAATLFLAEIVASDGLSMDERAESLAGYIAWLCENRAVKKGSRFLVEGEDPRVVDNIVTGTFLGDRICHILTDYVTNPASFNGDATCMARIRDGSLQIMSRFVHAAWSTVFDKENRPSPRKIGKTFGSLCESKMPTERVTINGKSETVNFWKVDTNKLETWCRRSDYKALEALREALSVDTKSNGRINPPLEKIRGGKQGEANGQ